jgi:Uma2 family endonuclease
LVLEIDITSSSLDKFLIYGALGVPEIWRYNGKVLRVSLWNAENETYEKSDYSLVFS